MSQQAIIFARKHHTLQGIGRLTLIMFILLGLIYQQCVLSACWLKLLLSFLIGFILSGMINLAHECLHQKFVEYRWLKRK